MDSKVQSVSGQPLFRRTRLNARAFEVLMLSRAMLTSRCEHMTADSQTPCRLASFTRVALSLDINRSGGLLDEGSRNVPAVNICVLRPKGTLMSTIATVATPRSGLVRMPAQGTVCQTVTLC